MNAIVTTVSTPPVTIELPPMPQRAPHTDEACRNADAQLLVTLLLLRHSALLKIAGDHHHRATIEQAIRQARNNAEGELLWRIWQYEGALKSNGIGLILAGP